MNYKYTRPTKPFIKNFILQTILETKLEFNIGYTVAENDTHYMIKLFRFDNDTMQDFHYPIMTSHKYKSINDEQKNELAAELNNSTRKAINNLIEGINNADQITG